MSSGKRMAVALALVAGLLALSIATPANAASLPQALAFSGQAYGTWGQAEGLTTSGRSANIVMGCNDRLGIDRSSRVLTSQVRDLLRSGVVETRVRSMENQAGDPLSLASSITKDLSALDGLIQADSAKAVSQTILKPGGFAFAKQVVFSGLTVAGTPQSASPSPNTEITLPGIGHVILNEQKPKLTETSAQLVIRAIHAHVTKADNPLGLPKGSEVIVSHAKSGLMKAAGLVGGTAYGTSLTVDDVVQSGPSGAVYLPCLGTNGGVRQNVVHTITTPGDLFVGAVVNSASGEVLPDSASAELVSRLTDVSLPLVIQAELIRAQANAAKVGGTRSFSSEGSRFGGLIIAGQPLTADEVEPNMAPIDVDGVGTLWLYRVIQGARSIEVRMVELIVEEENTLGLPVGSTLRAGVARARVN